VNEPEFWADMSSRMADCYASLVDWPDGRPIDLHVVASMIRCAYAAGYTDAHSDPEPVPIEGARVAEARLRLALPD
jgi:hypothetical protein